MRSMPAALIDITHEIPPQDVERGRLTVARVWRRFPAGTIHIVVVDPGVGSPRAALAIASDGRYLVGPDNGVLSPALLVAGARVVELQTPASASATFHGRDLFAPAGTILWPSLPMRSYPISSRALRDGLLQRKRWSSPARTSGS